MKQASLHIHPIERIWIIISFVMLGVFAAAVLTAGFAFGFQVPVPEDRLVDPNLVATPGATAFGEPGVKELSPGWVEARILSQAWTFTPKEITVKVGTKVTFYVTTKDVQHGFDLTDTNINMMVIPWSDLEAHDHLREARDLQLLLPRVLWRRAPNHVRPGHRHAVRTIRR